MTFLFEKDTNLFTVVQCAILRSMVFFLPSLVCLVKLLLISNNKTKEHNETNQETQGQPPKWKTCPALSSLALSCPALPFPIRGRRKKRLGVEQIAPPNQWWRKSQHVCISPMCTLSQNGHSIDTQPICTSSIITSLLLSQLSTSSPSPGCFPNLNLSGCLQDKCQLWDLRPHSMC